jgi:hypothetical protein
MRADFPAGVIARRIVLPAELNQHRLAYAFAVAFTKLSLPKETDNLYTTSPNYFMPSGEVCLPDACGMTLGVKERMGRAASATNLHNVTLFCTHVSLPYSCIPADNQLAVLSLHILDHHCTTSSTSASPYKLL